MGRMLSVNFWLQAFISAFVTMLMFYVIKKINNKIEIPIVSDIVEQA